MDRRHHLYAGLTFLALGFVGGWFILSQYWMEPFSRGLSIGLLIGLWTKPMVDHFFYALFGDVRERNRSLG